MESGQSMSKEYVLSDEFFPWFTRRMRTRMLYIAVLIALIGTGASAYGIPWHSVGMPLGMRYLLLLGPTVLLLVIWLIQFPMLNRRQLESYKSYKIVIDGNTVSRTQDDHQDVVLERADIKKIEEREASGLIVFGQTRLSRIWIPLKMADYDGLKRELGALKPIDRMRGSLIDGVGGAKGLIGFILVSIFTIGVYIFTGNVGLESWLVVSMPIVIFFERRNPNISKRLIRSMWLGWAFLLILLLVRFRLV